MLSYINSLGRAFALTASSRKCIFLFLFDYNQNRWRCCLPRLVRAMQNVQYRFHQIRHETNEKPTLHALLLLSSRAFGVYTKLNNYLSAKCDKFQQ